MGKGAKCVVPNCSHGQQHNSTCILAKFPLEIERCKRWVQLVGVLDLVNISVSKLNTLRFVCGCHFTDDQFSNPTKKRLKRTAVPSRFNPSVVPLSDDVMKTFISTNPKLMTTAITVPLYGPYNEETSSVLELTNSVSMELRPKEE